VCLSFVVYVVCGVCGLWCFVVPHVASVVWV
jgi:uncharacterized membrane protein YuzA (DUF378 family)